MNLRKPALGTILGATALAVALTSTGGVAEAAKLINGKLIKANTVTTKQIKDGTITPADLSAAAKVVGPKGDPGAPGLSGLERLIAIKFIAANTQDNLTKSCSPGKVLISATAYWSSHNDAVQVEYLPNNTQATAFTTGQPGPSGDMLSLKIICANVS